MGACELFVEWFKSVNPNGKAPAIVHVKEDGTSVTVFESAPVCYTSPANLTKNELLYPPGTPEYWTQLSWVCAV